MKKIEHAAKNPPRPPESGGQRGPEGTARAEVPKEPPLA
jgi:hypothetical protein